MGATGDINYFDGSIICNTSLVAQGSENADVTGWTIGTEFVLATAVYFGAACNKTTDNEGVQIEFRKDGGGWTQVGAATEISYGSTLTNGNNISAIKTTSANAQSACTTTTGQTSGVQVSGTYQATSFSIASETWTEIHWNLDTTNASAGSTYEFRLYNNTATVYLTDESTTNQVIDAAITMASAPATQLVHTDAGEDYCYFDDNDGGNLTLVQTTPPVTLVHTDAGEDYLLLNDNDAAALTLTQVHILDVQEAYSALDDNDGNPLTITSTAPVLLVIDGDDLVISDNDGNPLTLTAPAAVLVVADGINGHHAENVDLAFNYETTWGATGSEVGALMTWIEDNSEAQPLQREFVGAAVYATKISFYLYEHLNPGRVAIYQNDDLTELCYPYNGDLIKDCGATTGTATGWNHITIDPPVAIDTSRRTWLCFKADDTGTDEFIIRTLSYPTNEYGTLENRNCRIDILDVPDFPYASTEAWPSTYTDNNESTAAGAALNTYITVTVEAGGNTLRVHEAEHPVASDDVVLVLNPVASAEEATHIQTADSPVLSVTAWTNPDTFSYDTSVAAKNYRMVLPNTLVDQDGDYVRVKIECHNIDAVTIGGMSIGAQDDVSPEDFADFPTRITFDGGSHTVSVPGGTTKWSDWVPFGFDSTVDHLVHTHLSGPHKFSYITTMDTYSRNSATDDTMTVDVSSYSLENQFYYLVSLEVRARTALDFADAVNLHEADNLVLTQTYNLDVAEAYHLHDADAADLNIAANLDVAEAYHLQEADAAEPLGFTYNLTVAEAYHLQEADAAEPLGIGYNLDTAEAYHLSESDNISLSGAVSLTVAEADHIHAGDNVDLTQNHALAADAAFHVTESDAVELTQGHNLSLDEAAHLLVSPNLTITHVLPGQHYLEMQEAAHLSESDNVDLTQVHDLTVAEAAHDQVADTLNLGGTVALTVAEAASSLISDNLSLTYTATLTVGEAAHVVSDEGPLALISWPRLGVADAVETIGSDTPALTQNHHLEITDNYLVSTSDRTSISIYGESRFPSSIFWTECRSVGIRRTITSL